MRRLLFAAIAILTVSAGTAYAGANSFGEMVSIEPSVRANGMADAYTAMQGDVNGIHYNPAHNTESKTAGFIFQHGYAEDSTGGLAVSLPRLMGEYSMGFSFLYYNTGDMDLFSSDGGQRTVTGQKDYLATASLSRKFGVYSLGANLKYAHTSLFETASDSTLLFDLGAIADYQLLRLGFAMQNLGGKMKLGTEEEHVPSNWRLGASKEISAGVMDITGAFDIVKRENEPAYVRVGAEFVYDKLLAMRTGYEFQNSLSADNTLRFGCGFIFNKITLDYALVPYQNLGTTHRFALAYKF